MRIVVPVAALLLIIPAYSNAACDPFTFLVKLQQQAEEEPPQLDIPLVQMDGVVQAVKIIHIREGQVFLTRRAAAPYEGFWEFPGGRVEPGETIRETFYRELGEELRKGKDFIVSIRLLKPVFFYAKEIQKISAIYPVQIETVEAFPHAHYYDWRRINGAEYFNLWNLPDGTFKPVREFLLKGYPHLAIPPPEFAAQIRPEE